MADCKECDNAKAKLKCLICEQTAELRKEKHTKRQFPEVITPAKDVPYAMLEPYERTIWVLYIAKFTEDEIAHTVFVHQSTVSRCIIRIKEKLGL